MSRLEASKFRYYGQFELPVDRFLHERYFPTAGPGKILLECGAFDGITESSGLFFEETLGWRAVNIEPSPRVFAALERNRPHSRNLNIALSNVVGTSTFCDVIHPEYEQCTNGSLAHTPLHRNILAASGCRFESAQVATTTYDALVHSEQLAEIELMVLDVEGHELEVLERLPFASTLPRVLCIEHGHLSISQLCTVLLPLGYKFDTLSYVNAFFVRCTP